MKISFIGIGYVGLITSLAICKKNPNISISCYDNNIEKINNLKKGIMPFFEKELKELFLECDNIDFTTKLEKCLDKSEAIFICVGTPLNDDNNLDTNFLNDVITSCEKLLKKDIIFVIKSTLPIGTTEKFNKKYSKNKYKFCFVSNPEFLSQGSAVYDALNPNRIILGTENDKAIELLSKIYENFQSPILKMKATEAELSKVSANSFLALKLSYANEISNICRNNDLSVNNVLNSMKYDKRIGDSYLSPGPGYGGSCLPKDTIQFYNWSLINNERILTIKSAIEVNNYQINLIPNLVIKNNLTTDNILFIGVTFKIGVDDTRDSPSVFALNKLSSLGYSNLFFYDTEISEWTSNNIATNNIKKINKSFPKFNTIIIFNDFLFNKIKNQLDLKNVNLLDVYGNCDKSIKKLNN